MSQTRSFQTKEPSQHQSKGTKKKIPRPKTERHVSESSELAFGQSVIVTARWILVLAGLFLVMWNPDELANLRIQVGVIILLALMNFYLQAQILMGRKTLETVVYVASLVDFTVITILIWLNGGFDSNTYVFYFPAILAISVAFDTAVTLGFVGSVTAIYFLICLGTGAFMEDNFMVLLNRVLMMAAIAFCSNLYWHIERKRRAAAAEAHEALIAEVRREARNQEETTFQEVYDA